MAVNALLFWLLSPLGAGDGFLEDLVTHYTEQLPVTRPFEGDLAEAMAMQDRFVAALHASHGPVVGYKAALTSSKAQRLFGVDHPLSGQLLREMLLPNGARVSLDFAARGLYEADLMVRVGSEAVNEAGNRKQMLAALDAVIPFLELPDLVYTNGVRPSGPALVAINTGARCGILGDAIPMADLSDPIVALARFTVTVREEPGGRSAEGKGADLLGHPLDAALWLRDALKARGIRLRPGDLLSLGSLTPLQPIRDTGTLTATYTGLLPDRPVAVTVTLVE